MLHLRKITLFKKYSYYVCFEANSAVPICTVQNWLCLVYCATYAISIQCMLMVGLQYYTKAF